MLTLNDTQLQHFSFGEAPEDTFYLLINTRVNPNGIDLEKLSRADPTRIDDTLADMGCLLMFNGEEMNELIRRGTVDEQNLHSSLFELALKEGSI